MGDRARRIVQINSRPYNSPEIGAYNRSVTIANSHTPEFV